MQIPYSFLEQAMIRPGQLPSLHVWLKADAGTDTTVNGAEVASWLDQSSSAYQFDSISSSRPTYIANAYNGLPALRFTAGTDYMDQVTGSSLDFKYMHDGSTDYTIFFVAKKNTTATTTNYPILSTARATSSIGVYVMTGQENTHTRLTIMRGVTGTLALNHISYFPSWNVSSKLGIYCISHAPSADVNNIYLGNVLNSTGSKINSYSTGNPQRVLSIGSMAITEKGGWDICELIIYKDVSDLHRKGIQNYLRSRWGA